MLTSTQQAVPRPGGMDELVDNLRSSGHDVDLVEVGTPRPLPPELDTVAYRVLQETLTNAIRHGRRDQPPSVERHWHDELRLQVRNAVDATDDKTHPIPAVGTAQDGHRLDGMHRRLAWVGGRLHVQRHDRDASPTFTATTWNPLRTVQP